MLRPLLFAFLIAFCLAKKHLNPRPHLDGFKVVGDDSAIKRVPWAVLYGGVCTGTILSEVWVLTAAHCGKESYVKVKSPSFDVRSGEIIWIIQHVIHPKYDEFNDDYDLQLVKLIKAIEFDNNAQPISIGRKSLIKPRSKITAVAWIDNHDDKTLTEDMVTITVPIMDKKRCKKRLKSEDAAEHLTEHMFCADFKKKNNGTCSSNSGGAATIKGKLVGLTSRSLGCFKYKRPGVYANVASLKQWILATMAESASTSCDLSSLLG